MRLGTMYAALGSSRLTHAGAAAIVEAARPRALAALGRPEDPPESLNVSAVLVEPAAARGGSLIPAWPFRLDDGSVRIEFVSDWGAMLAAWRAGLELSSADAVEIDTLLATGERTWVGIANDVLQLYVADPPAGTYSMVRHHGLMLAAATLWLGARQAERWRRAHRLAASAFLRRAGARPLWEAIADAEHALDSLLAANSARADAQSVVAWLDSDADARANYTAYLGAASLGVAALLESAPTSEANGWLEHAVRLEHPRPDFNREPIERLAATIQAEAA